MKNKIMWKDVTLIVLAILLIFSMCRIRITTGSADRD